MTVGQMILETVYAAMHWPAFRDSPAAPWRDHPDVACIERRCERHESCMRREAFCTFEAWYERARCAEIWNARHGGES